MYIPRALESHIHKSLSRFPVTALLGPRQCGKSTLARHIMDEKTNAVYLDLERPSDLNKLDCQCGKAHYKITENLCV